MDIETTYDFGVSIEICCSPSTWSTFTLHYARRLIDCKIGLIIPIVQPLDDFKGPWIFMIMALGPCVNWPLG